MSRKKHNISYIKPEEPKFLRELKAAAGYQEGPDVDTKRGELPGIDSDEDREDNPEEEPTIVVLKEGDLTAEEADEFKKKKEEEEANAPADLSKRIIFESKRKSKTQDDDENEKSNTKNKKSKKSSKPTKSVLSFNEEEEDE